MFLTRILIAVIFAAFKILGLVDKCGKCLDKNKAIYYQAVEVPEL
jgi:hypothetical protein